MENSENTELTTARKVHQHLSFPVHVRASNKQTNVLAYNLMQLALLPYYKTVTISCETELSVQNLHFNVMSLYANVEPQ